MFILQDFNLSLELNLKAARTPSIIALLSYKYIDFFGLVGSIANHLGPVDVILLLNKKYVDVNPSTKFDVPELC